MKKIIVFVLFTFSIVLFNINIFAKDNIYKTSFEVISDSEIAKSMINNNILNDVYIEKNDDISYFYIKLNNKESFKDFNLSINNKNLGFYEYNDYYLYSIETNNLFSNINVSAYVPEMKKDVEFGIKLLNNLESATFEVSSYHPALYIPKLEYSGKDYYNVSLNNTFIFPNIKATFDNNEIGAKIFLNEELTNESQYTFINQGIYKLKYVFEIDSYKDSNNNNAKIEKTITLNVIKNDIYGGRIYVADNGAIINDINKTIFESADIISVNHKIGDMYYEIMDKLNNYSRLSIVYVNLIDKDGNVISFDDELVVDIPLEKSFNYNKLKAYYYSNEELKEISGKASIVGYKINTKNLGYFVIIEEETYNLNYFIFIIMPISFAVILDGIFIRRKKYEKNIYFI